METFAELYYLGYQSDVSMATVTVLQLPSSEH